MPRGSGYYPIGSTLYAGHLRKPVEQPHDYRSYLKSPDPRLRRESPNEGLSTVNANMPSFGLTPVDAEMKLQGS